ncbi:hypothetical protein AGRA3207_007227 [Actinomadura graeca]|uniref:Uncharacterized protein n=1 Tax=Actinomadura graeca TaxID=2750812 RepID=A0ABX8R5L3_9ACTN|nr:hypothetical protein [Actinomadura graeca]QXJ25699.1 hypothetical protein AGRA3207_007227 [Actinomadura graeca]
MPPEMVAGLRGPVVWSYSADDGTETARVAARLVTAMPAGRPAGDQAVLSVRSVRDGAGLDRLAATASGPAQRLREENYRRAPDHGAWVRSGDRPADATGPGLPLHAIVHRGGRWTILHADDSGAEDRARVGDVVLRGLVAAVLAARGALTVHASAATDGEGRAVVFLGDSGSGKSTLALHLARAGATQARDARTGGGFVSGDRTLLVPGREGWWAVGSGLLPRFRWGTLTGLGLAGRVRAASLLRHGDGHHRLGDLPRTPNKVIFTPRESEHVLGVRTVDCAPIGRLVVLSAAEGGAPAVRPLGPGETAAAVRAHLLPSDAGFLEWHFPRCPDGLRDVTGLAADVARTRLEWDPVRHHDQDPLGHVLADATATEAP